MKQPSSPENNKGMSEYDVGKTTNKSKKTKVN